jgi:hypothetical protein
MLNASIRPLTSSPSSSLVTKSVMNVFAAAMKSDPGE